MHFSLLQDKIWFGLSSIWDIMSFPIPSFSPFLCSSAKVVHQPLKVERSSGKPFRSESSSCGEYSPRKPFPFNVCTQKCRRQRKWATDENVEEDKQTAYKRVLTLITHLYAVLASIHRGTIILQQMNIGQAVNFTPSKNIDRFIRCYSSGACRCTPVLTLALSHSVCTELFHRAHSKAMSHYFGIRSMFFGLP